MKVKVSLLQAQLSLPPDNVQITADATVTVGDVAHALAGSDRRAGQYQSGRPLSLARVDGTGGQRPLPPDQTLLDSGIASGTTVAISYADTAAPATDSTPAVALLRVLSGPDAGTEFPLRLGATTLGRAHDCDVRLTDPQVSKVHARIVVGNKVEIIDRGSSNGVWVGGVRVNRLHVAVGDEITVGHTTLSVVAISQWGQQQATSTDVAFVRQPRVVTRPEDTPIELPDAPVPQKPQRFPWLMLMPPVLIGVILVLRFTTSSAPSSTALFGLAFVALSPLMLLGNYFEQRRQKKESFQEAVALFESTLASRTEELRLGHEVERLQLERAHPSSMECLDAINRQSDVLWSRRPEHPEFLSIRVGTGNIAPHHHPVPSKVPGLPEFQNRANALAAEYATLTHAPVIANVRVVGGLGLAGPDAVREPVARAIVTQIATLHSPSEVVLACLTSTLGRRRWDWLEWLPHTASPHSPLPAHLAADSGTGTALLNQLEELIAIRGKGGAVRLRGPLEGKEKADTPTVPSVVVIVDDTAVDTARLTRIAEKGPDVGVYVLWIADSMTLVPAPCRTFVEISEASAHVGMVRQETTIRSVVCESVDAATAASVARRLAPLVDAGTPVDDDSDLPRSVSVVSLFGHEASDDPAVIAARWHENQSISVRDGSTPVPREHDADLRAVVGHAGTEHFTLDLRTQGPHALVGGTTGAGKSEFLQAWVLGLAHAYSPDRVTFLFVDYKGGAAFARCTDLPHCVGLVTDLSPYLVRRALRSLRAELHYRERLLNAKGKKDLIELEKTGDPECPPSLIIVVDEFAALVSEVPEFVDGVVDVAQRGRSLGLHLVLATQRPAGVIKDNLRANTNLRVALRMADESDSQDVLGEPMAAYFPSSVPGRGAAKTGPGRITQFQSAFPGARTSAQAEASPIEVSDLAFGRITPWKLPEPPKTASTVAKDIDRVVSAISGAVELSRIPAARRPWLESLAPIYNLARLNPRRDTRIPIGVVDDPDHQAQVVEYFRPDEEGNVLYVGTGSSGKSTALRSLAVAASITPGGGQTHVYGLDFAGGSLGALDLLPNVGAVVQAEDDERVQRLLTHLQDVIEERSVRYSAVSATSLDEYRTSAERPQEPRILLLLDGFTSFRSAYETTLVAGSPYSRLQRILLYGRAVGVHVALTADRPSAIPTSMLSAFQRRIVLRLADTDAYLAMGVPRDILDAGSLPGRAIQVEQRLEMQLAVFLTQEHAAAENASSAAQAAAIDGLARAIAGRHSTPVPIRSLPPAVSSRELPARVGALPTLGVSDITLEPMGFDPRGAILLSGPAQSGRTNAIQWLAESFRRRWPETPLVHLSARRSPLTTLDLWSASADTEAEAREIVDRLQDLATEQAPQDMPLVALFVEFYPEYVGTPLEQPLQKLVQALRRGGHPIVAEGESTAWNSPWPLVMEVRNGRTGLLLQPDQPEGDTLLRTSLPRVRRADLPPGRGFWIRGGKAHKVQLPLADGWGDSPIDGSADVPDAHIAGNSGLAGLSANGTTPRAREEQP